MTMTIVMVCPNCFMETDHLAFGILLTCQRCGHTHAEGVETREEK